MKDNMKGMMVNEQYNQLMDAMLDIMIGISDKEKPNKNDTVVKVKIVDVDEDETEPNPGILMLDVFSDEDKIPSYDEEYEASKQVKCKTELSLYLFRIPLPLESKNQKGYSDPLKWWEVHESRYPLLSKLAVEFLAIPATYAPSERI